MIFAAMAALPRPSSSDYAAIHGALGAVFRHIASI